MKWEMEVEEIEAVLERILDLHDKLSDAIHSISRAHFLNSIKNRRKFDEFYLNRRKRSGEDVDQKSGPGFVFVKESPTDEEDSSVHEAKSLYAIRAALENLEDQLELFHTVQTQKRVERDASIVRLEQSRIMLAMRLAEHQGKKYKVIEEARALVGDVQNASLFVDPQHLYSSTPYHSGKSFVRQEKGERPNPIVNFFFSTSTFVSKSLKLNHTVGILGNAALIAISMLAFMNMNQDRSTYSSEFRKGSYARVQTSSDRFTELDVLLARG